MIKLKLADLAKKLDKSVTDIAQETQLNRNTITALYHNKVDGIKFETLERICQTYKVGITDLIELDLVKADQPELGKLYKQEGGLVPFTCWPWQLAVNDLNPKNFSFGFGKQWNYMQNDYGHAYWQKDKMANLAQYIYQNFNTQEKFNRLYQDFIVEAQALQKIYLQAREQNILDLSFADLKQYLEQVRVAFSRFWSNSLFVDAFDSGFDQTTIKEVAAKHQLTIKEIEILTTSLKKTFNKERELALLEIVRKLKANKHKGAQLTAFLQNFIENSQEIKDYVLNYNYYKSNYAFVDQITEEELINDLKKYLSDKNLAETDYENLLGYEKNQAQAVAQVLRSHNLKTNPLYFFSQLTYWREYRKQINLMGIHVLEMILASLEKKTGIPKKYLKYLAFDEIDHVFKGTIDLDILKRRREEGCLIMIEGKDYKILLGEQALSLQNELEKQLTTQTSKDTITGQVACQGYAKGIAKVILSPVDFAKFNEGEILVTSMTRPEFVPLMKKAAGIVTNEGGVTCHAAIVSRELGKPCIIGTGNATQLIKDNDLVEVRANHGTVRILQ